MASALPLLRELFKKSPSEVTKRLPFPLPTRGGREHPLFFLAPPPPQDCSLDVSFCCSVPGRKAWGSIHRCLPSRCLLLRRTFLPFQLPPSAKGCEAAGPFGSAVLLPAAERRGPPLRGLGPARARALEHRAALLGAAELSRVTLRLPPAVTGAVPGARDIV